MKDYFVYIMTNRSRTLYVGVTNDLFRRVQEHREGRGSVFTSKYHVDQLVYFESGQDVYAAIAREKQIKGWLRAKKIALIDTLNPEDRLLVETDAPYLTPQPMRKERNQPAYVTETAQFLAEARGVTYAELDAIVHLNAATLFGW